MGLGQEAASSTCPPTTEFWKPHGVCAIIIPILHIQTLRLRGVESLASGCTTS